MGCFHVPAMIGGGAPGGLGLAPELRRVSSAAPTWPVSGSGHGYFSSSRRIWVTVMLRASVATCVSAQGGQCRAIGSA